MNRILSISTENSVSCEEINKVADQYPIDLQPLVKEAFQEAEKKNFEKAAKLCCKLLDQYAALEVRMLLGTCYFMQNHMQVARQVFSDLVLDYPEEESCRIL